MSGASRASSEFAPHADAVVSIGTSQRDKGFVTADASGAVHVRYGTSGQTLLTMRPERGGVACTSSWRPRAMGSWRRTGGTAGQWRLDNPHPEVTLGTLFGKVWYEGYSPARVRVADPPAAPTISRPS